MILLLYLSVCFVTCLFQRGNNNTNNCLSDDFLSVTACDSAHCLNGGTCSVTTTHPFYQCACEPQYHGRHCGSML